jgi:putrescine aminotransferase
MRRNIDPASSARHHHLAPVSNPAVYAAVGPKIMERGEGCWLIDEEGNRYFDAIAGLASVPIGYSNCLVTDAATHQLQRLPYYHSFFHMGNGPSAALAERLAQRTPEGIDHFFFASSGSEAVETAIKIAWAYWLAKGKPHRRTVISREFGYHGNTIFATELSGISHYHEGFGIAEDADRRIMAPYRYHYDKSSSQEAFGERAAAALEEKILGLGPENVAAFIGEPVQGTGGAIYPPENYWPRIREICTRYGVLLIADEVMTGFGRLGHWFGQQHFGFTADLMTMSKGLTSSYLPMSSVGIASHVYQELHGAGEYFVHGFTASAHPTCAALACANLDVIADEGLVERVKDDIGPWFTRLLAEQIEPLAAIAEVRGAGLMWGVELDRERFAGCVELDLHDLAAPIVEAMLIDGVIIRNSSATIMLSPPLIMTRDEATDLIGKLARALKEFDRRYATLGRVDKRFQP